MEERVSQPVSGVRFGVGVGGAISAIYLEANFAAAAAAAQPGQSLLTSAVTLFASDDNVGAGAECVLNGKNVCRVSARLGLS